MRSEKKVKNLLEAYKSRLYYSVDTGYQVLDALSMQAAINILEWVLSSPRKPKKSGKGGRR